MAALSEANDILSRLVPKYDSVIKGQSAPVGKSSASELLERPGLPGGLPGGGVFPRYSAALRLTAPGRSRSVWRLPDCFEPRPGTQPLSYHASAKRWSRDHQGILLSTAGRGQEFALDGDSYPGVLDWVARAFTAAR